MKTLVIDASCSLILRDATAGRLARKHHFLLIDWLLQEIATHGSNPDHSIPPAEERTNNPTIRNALTRALGLPGRGCLNNEFGILWEVGRGESARTAPGAVLSLDLALRIACSGEIEEESRAVEENLRRITSIPMMGPRDPLRNALRRIQGKKEFFVWLAEALARPDVRRKSMEEARGFAAIAVQRGWINQAQISPSFRPDEGWLSFGIMIAAEGLRLWKLWAHQNRDVVLPNPFFDAMYVAYVAIADGLLSCDRGQLGLAWAVWPAKRNGLYYWDQCTGAERPFSLD